MSNEREPGLNFASLLADTGDVLFNDFTIALAGLMQRGLSQQPHSTQQLVDDTLGAGGSLAAVVGLDPVVVTAILVQPGLPNVPVFQVMREVPWTQH